MFSVGVVDARFQILFDTLYNSPKYCILLGGYIRTAERLVPGATRSWRQVAGTRTRHMLRERERTIFPNGCRHMVSEKHGLSFVKELSTCRERETFSLSPRAYFFSNHASFTDAWSSTIIVLSLGLQS